MTSVIAWLDASREDQQRMREIVNLFSQSESRDELGIGQVRDAFSDSLFPGTSTLHTRARYLLFIPWCYQAAEAAGFSGFKLERRVEDNERALIGGLKDLGATDGLIGRVAGVAVKTLPSSLYAGALRQYDILTGSDPLLSLRRATSLDLDQDELVDRAVGAWCSTLPPIPVGFPRHPETGFELSGPEAYWLQERMLGGTEGSLLHHLVSDGNRPESTSAAPWEDPACQTSPADVQQVLEHARLFSLVVQGSSLLYNLLVAEHYEQAGHSKIENPVATYRTGLEEWTQECADDSYSLSAWDRPSFWRHVRSVNPRVGATTQSFLTTWFAAVCGLQLDHVCDDASLRKMVENRERKQKGTQSRLTNDRLLASWSGAAGTARLTYRWTQVDRLMQDLHDGLEAADAGS